MRIGLILLNWNRITSLYNYKEPIQKSTINPFIWLGKETCRMIGITLQVEKHFFYFFFTGTQISQ